MIAAEREHVEKSRMFHDLEVRHKQLLFLLDRLNSYNTQATLVTGFAFTAFSADALHDLPYEAAPVRSFVFAFFAALAMSTAVGCVGVSSYLMWRAERLAMCEDVLAAVAAVRQGIPLISAMYVVSLVGLFGAACGLLFAMCHSETIGKWNSVGYMVVGLFTAVIIICVIIGDSIRRKFDRIETSRGSVIWSDAMLSRSLQPALADPPGVSYTMSSDTPMGSR